MIAMSVAPAERIRSALSHIDPRDRQTWVRMAMAVKAELGDDGFSVWDEWSSGASNYDPRAARDTWRSIRADGGVGAGSLFHEARRNGWRGDAAMPSVPARPRVVPTAQHDAEREARAQRAREVAARVWDAARPAGDDHPYLLRKRVRPTETLRELDADPLAGLIGYRPQSGGEPLQGRILIAPVHIGGELSTLEFVDELGRKAALAGGRKRGGIWSIATLPEAGRLVLAEGAATALSISEALGEPVAAALSVGNLRAAGEALRADRPGVELVIAADLADGGQPHPQALEAARALGCGIVAPPAELGAGSDFNDARVTRGLDAVRAAFEHVGRPEPEGGEADGDAALDAEAAQQWPEIERALSAVPAGASLGSESGYEVPAHKVIGRALRTWAGDHRGRIVAARAACVRWDASQGGGASAARAFDAADPDHPAPLTLASLYRLAAEHDGGALDRDAILETAQRRLEPDVGERMPAYPVHALGPLADACESIARGQQVHPAIVGNGLLATAALLTSGLFDVEGLEGGRRAMSLFTLTVAVSGAGKDASDRLVTGAIHRWQQRANDAYREALRDHERAMAGRKRGDEPPEPPTAPHRLCADMTVEGLRRAFAEGVPAQGVFSTEAAAILAGHGFSAEHRAKTAASLCGLWDRGHLSVLRAGGGRFERYGLRLSAHLAIQPVAVTEALHDPLLAQVGLWPRFLLAWPPSPAPRRFQPWHPERDPAVCRWWARCEELLALPLPDGDDGRLVLRLSDEARRVLAQFFEGAERRAVKGGDLWDVRPLALRAAEQATRIAGVLAAIRGHAVVGADDAACGVELAAYSLDCWRVALDRRRKDKGGEAALTLLRWLVQRPGAAASASDILRLGPSKLRSASARDEAIERLREVGLVQVRDGVVHATDGCQDATPAKVANSAKTLDAQGFAPCEELAKGCECGGRDGDEAGAIRKSSQAVRNPETLENQGFSQDSQDSQGQDQDIAQPADMPEAAAANAWGEDAL